jgi:hypothetical protein
MTTGVDPVSEGREAWAKINRATSFASWKAIALAVAIGRQSALREANSNKPFGKKYAAAINRWLDEHGFREMSCGIRSACCVLADHMEQIESWRNSLPGAKRCQNQPEVIVRNWRRAGKATSRPRQQKIILQHMTSEAARKGRAIFWPQDAMRRAHTAMLDSRSTDLLVLARLALQAAIRCEGDLLALLDDRPNPTFRPRDTSEKAAQAAVAA